MLRIVNLNFYFTVINFRFFRFKKAEIIKIELKLEGRGREGRNFTEGNGRRGREGQGAKFSEKNFFYEFKKNDQEKKLNKF